MSSDPIEVLRDAARNAVIALRNCVNARQIGEGYRQIADDLDNAIAEYALASLSAPKPESAEAVAWKDSEGQVWASMDEVPSLYLPPERTFRPLVYGDTAPPRPEASAPVGVEGLAGKIGVHYAQHESCKPGVPFYAFTYGELQRFADALAQQPAPVAPVGVEGLPRFGFPKGDEPRPVPCADGYWTPWHLAQQPAAVDEATCVAVYDAVSRANLTREIKTEARKAAIVRAALAGQQQGGES